MIQRVSLGSITSRRANNWVKVHEGTRRHSADERARVTNEENARACVPSRESARVRQLTGGKQSVNRSNRCETRSEKVCVPGRQPFHLSTGRPPTLSVPSIVTTFGSFLGLFFTTDHFRWKNAPVSLGSRFLHHATQKESNDDSARWWRGGKNSRVKRALYKRT